MPHRHTIPVAMSAMLFLCLILHAQTNATLQGPVLYDAAEAYSVYESLLPTDWTITVAHARRLLIQAQTVSMNFCLKPVPESATLLHCGGGTFHVLEKKDGVWKNLRWKGTSCAWAS